MHRTIGRCVILMSCHGCRLKPEDAGTHKSVKAHAGTVFLCLVTVTFDLMTPNGFMKLTVDHFYVTFGDLRYNCFLKILRGETDRPTDKQTDRRTDNARTLIRIVNIGFSWTRT